MGSTSSVLQWHCKHCRAINTTENAVCIRCGSRRGAYHDKRPPPVPSRQFKISKRNIVFESHLYDDAEGCDPPPVPAHKSTELREPSSSHLYAELDPEEEDSNGEYAVLEYPEPPNAFPAHQPPKQEPIYGELRVFWKFQEHSVFPLICSTRPAPGDSTAVRGHCGRLSYFSSRVLCNYGSAEPGEENRCKGIENPLLWWERIK